LFPFDLAFFSLFAKSSTADSSEKNRLKKPPTKQPQKQPATNTGNEEEEGEEEEGEEDDDVFPRYDCDRARTSRDVNLCLNLLRDAFCLPLKKLFAKE